jgi:hypothetical protein
MFTFWEEHQYALVLVILRWFGLAVLDLHGIYSLPVACAAHFFVLAAQWLEKTIATSQPVHKLGTFAEWAENMMNNTT